MANRLFHSGAALFAAGIAAGTVIVGGLWLGERPSNAAPNQSSSQARSFPDVPPNHWAAKAVSDLSAKGIIKAPAGSAYDGNKYVTRYEAAVLLDRFVQYIENGRKPLHVTRLAPGQMPKFPKSWAHDAQSDLVSYKFLPPTSPLLSRPGTAPVKASEMSAAVAQVANRLSDRSIPATPNADDDEN